MAAVSTPPAAQEGPPADVTSPLASELRSCFGMADDAARLACYDRVAESLVGSREAAEDEAVMVLRGENDADSETFSMTEPWRIAWVLDGSILTVELHTSQGQLQDIVGNQIGAGEGASRRLEPGDWQLAVRAVGPWQIRIVRD